MAKWFFEKGGQQQGPISSAELKQIVANGELRPDDLLWKEGLKDWLPARNVKGLFAAPQSNGSPPPIRATSQQPALAPASTPHSVSQTDISPVSQQMAHTAPPLWNPAAACAWSVLFSWGFGAFLVSRNWKALGEEDRAKRSMYWFYSVFAFLVLAMLTPDTTAMSKLFRLIGFGCLVAWAILDAIPQVQFVKERFGREYPRKPWVRPFVITVLIILVALMFVGILIGLLSASSDDQNITLVKTGRLNAFPGIELGPVIDSFFEDPEWEAIIADDGEHYVNATGGMMYMDKPVTGKVQFHIVGQTFEFTAFELNGIPQNDIVKNVLVRTMYEEFGK